MKNFNKNLMAAALTTFVALGFAGPISALAITATAPNLGAASTFSVLAGSAMTSAAVTTIAGDLGVSPGNTRTGTWVHTGGADYLAGATAASAMSAASAAWTTMGSSGGTAWNPAADFSPAPGLYTRSGDATFTGGTPLTLSGSATDVWIFQINSSLTFTGTVNLTGGAQACNVFWRIASDATINGAPGNTFVGTLIANSNVSLVSGASVDGRMVAITGTLSTAGTTNITGPTGCVVAPAAVSSSRAAATINVVKVVVNDGGGTKTIADFPLFVNGSLVFSGVTNTFPAPASAYVVTETSDSHYTQSFSGDCDASGRLNLVPGDNKFCIVTNNDIATPVVPPIPPLIDVVKTASPLSLPDGPGLVVYTYTLRNVGVVPVANITMIGDSCTPIVLASGDTNGDGKLDLNETWVYRCSTTLTKTHTNTVVATGWANGISAVDIASATVVVGVPIVPPLIHVTKVPSPLALVVGGGAVMYSYVVTNPGVTTLHDVAISDDKCAQIFGPFGDANGNRLLEPDETWAYACRTNLTKTTTNTVSVEGSAHGFNARDFAIATVVVASPKLPNTGFPPEEKTGLLNIALLFPGILAVLYIIRKRTTA